MYFFVLLVSAAKVRGEGDVDDVRSRVHEVSASRVAVHLPLRPAPVPAATTAIGVDVDVACL